MFYEAYNACLIKMGINNRTKAKREDTEKSLSTLWANPSAVIRPVADFGERLNWEPQTTNMLEKHIIAASSTKDRNGTKEVRCCQKHSYGSTW